MSEKRIVPVELAPKAAPHSADEVADDNNSWGVVFFDSMAVLAEHSVLPVDVRGELARLPEVVEAALYFVCSEALANVAKHAAATRATIEVRAEAGRVSVTIVDDGRGGADPTRGSGLRGLADRVEALGGRLAVESEPGTGTRVTAEIPVPG